MESYQPITLSAGLIFVKGILFFFTFSHNIKLIKDLMTKDQRIKPVIKIIK